MDFPELGAAPKPAAPPPSVQPRPGMGGGFGDRPAGPSGPGHVSATARWASRPEEPRPASTSATRKLDNDWAEDDDGGMDFSKPIVIKRDDEPVSKTSGTSSFASAGVTPLDPKEEAKMLAMKKQEELKRMQEDIANQARNQEKQAIENERREMEEREEQRRREMQERTNIMEQRRKEEEEARVRHRAEAEARREEEMARREEEAKKREEAEKLRAEEREKQRQAEKELVANQQQYMAESVQAAKLRRQQEEEADRAAMKARAAEKLAELDRRAAERAAEKVAEQAKLDAEKPPAPAPAAAVVQAEQMERAGMGSKMIQPAAKPRASPWNQHPSEGQNVDAERTQWAALRKEDRQPVQPPPARPGPDNRGPGGFNQAPYGGFARGAPQGEGMAGAPNNRGGPGGARQLYDPKSDRFSTVDDAAFGQVRKEMAEREAREAKLKEKQAARDAARKEMKDQKQLAEKDAPQGPSREELKKAALEERRKRDADRRARGNEVSPDEIQNADPQRGSGYKGKHAGGQGNNAQQGSQGVGTDSGKKVETVDDALPMPITAMGDLLYANGAPAGHAWSGNFSADVWGTAAKPAGSLMLGGGDMKQGGGVMARGAGRMQFQQNRSPEKGDEGDRRKMQDANEVATKSADFLLDNDEHMPDMQDGMGALPTGGASFSSWQQPAVARAPWGNASIGNATWDGGPFGAHIGFGVGGSAFPSSLLALPSHQVWDSSSGLGGQELATSQWASGSASANVPRAWSAQPQSGLPSDALLAGSGCSAHADKPSQAPVNNKQHGNHGKGKQHREPKPARGGKGGAPGHQREKKDNAQADTGASGKLEDAASGEQANGGQQQGAGRGGGKGARGGHSAPSNQRNKQNRGPKHAAGGDGETPKAPRDSKDGGSEYAPKPARSLATKIAPVSQDIKQQAAAFLKQREEANKKAPA
jgi:hypothetical protein